MEAVEQETRAVAGRWFDALGRHDGAAALAVLADDVEWINNPAVKGLSDVIPWLGVYHGREAVLGTFTIWAALSEVKEFELLDLFVKGNDALAIVHEKALIKTTGKFYDIEFIQRLSVRDGHIARWKSYWDTCKGIVAFRADL